MICERWMHPGWLSNTYLVAARDGGEGLVIDSGAEPGPTIEAARSRGLDVRWIVNTHHHHDHVASNEALRGALGARVAAHALDAGGIGAVDHRLEDGEEIEVSGLGVKVLHIPGHTAGQIALLVAGGDPGRPGHLFTGDTLFRRSVGGTRAPGHTTFDDLRRSLLDRLLSLPGETIVHPGHTVPTTVGEELADNPFIRVMRGVDPEGSGTCRFGGKPARLIVWARDYDDGYKAWVRFEDGEDAVVPGSLVRR